MEWLASGPNTTVQVCGVRLELKLDLLLGNISSVGLSSRFAQQVDQLSKRLGWTHSRDPEGYQATIRWKKTYSYVCLKS